MHRLLRHGLQGFLSQRFSCLMYNADEGLMVREIGGSGTVPLQKAGGMVIEPFQPAFPCGAVPGRQARRNRRIIAMAHAGSLLR
jgi:hypothetical protein